MTMMTKTTAAVVAGVEGTTNQVEANEEEDEEDEATAAARTATQTNRQTAQTTTRTTRRTRTTTVREGGEKEEEGEERTNEVVAKDEMDVIVIIEIEIGNDVIDMAIPHRRALLLTTATREIRNVVNNDATKIVVERQIQEHPKIVEGKKHLIKRVKRVKQSE
jgi:hypothetical protein